MLQIIKFKRLDQIHLCYQVYIDLEMCRASLYVSVTRPQRLHFSCGAESL